MRVVETAGDDNLDIELDAAVRREQPTLPGGSEPDLQLPQLQPSVYQWSVRWFSLVRRMLGINIKLHDDGERLRQGDIFLFNHFARFETFIPQYLIYLETGAYCRSVASQEFFRRGDRFSNYLLNLGAVGNEHPDLLAFLGAEILRGRKIVIFPEGGMVKDRRVQDEQGRFNVYSRSAAQRRPHHSGAAVLALALSRFKDDVLAMAAAGQAGVLNAWARRLGFAGGEALLRAARRPTRIVPANITFYPIRIDSNILRRGAALIGRGWSPRAMEELLVEGHLLLRHTDMDIRLGRPLTVPPPRRRLALGRRAVGEFEAYFRPDSRLSGWRGRLYTFPWRRKVVALRDRYMHGIYAEVTVNLSHLTASVILRLIRAGRLEVEACSLSRVLYLAVKYCQQQSDIALHRSLRNPETYRGLLDGDCAGLQQFIEATVAIGLLEREGAVIRFKPRLLEEHAFDRVRLDNPIAVYANEVAPRHGVIAAVERALSDADRADEQRLGALRFDDESVEYVWDRTAFDKPRHAAVNGAQTASADARPYLLRGQAGRIGVVLCHGLLASPAELKPLAEALHAAGYSVLGVRLKGHGTSPWDLNTRSWSDWLQSLERGCELMRSVCTRLCLVGFSAGGTLCLRYAAEKGDELDGVVTLAGAFAFRDRRMNFVPLLHSVNKLTRWLAAEGLSTFYPNDPEFPDINYRHIPVRSLWELRRLVEDTRRRLDAVSCPLLVLQGDADPVIDPASARLIYQGVASTRKQLRWVEADWHGIVRRDPGKVIADVLEFVDQCERARAES